MKKYMALALALVLALGLLAGCGTSKEDGKVKIGISQFVAHPALDQAYKGFVDGLAEGGYKEGENLVLDFQNAQGEQSNCSIIANALVNSNADMILSIGTPAAQAVAAATKERQDLPVLITAITNPADAGLVASNEAPGGNVTGTSDLGPIQMHMELIQQLVPSAQKIGFIYCSSEANSIYQVGLARQYAEELGWETQDFTVSNTNEIQQVAQGMVGKVDAVYVPTDNMMSSAIANVSKVCIEGKLPMVVGEVAQVEGGGLASYSVDYYELGKITAQQALDILSGKSKPAEMPVQYQKEYALSFNEKTAEAIGVTLPAELAEKI